MLIRTLHSLDMVVYERKSVLVCASDDGSDKSNAYKYNDQQESSTEAQEPSGTDVDR